MQDVFVYLDGWKWPLNPASIQFRLPTHSATYELVGAGEGEAEILQGAKLADIQLKGFLPGMESHYAQEEPMASEFVEKIRAMVEESKPVRFVYTGKAWDLNFLVSVQSPVFREQGGSFDLDYEVSLRKWVEVGPELLVNGSGRKADVQEQPRQTMQERKTNKAVIRCRQTIH